jgi:SulP family sulfate permease
LYRDRSRYGNTTCIPGVVILRFESSLLYTNSEYLIKTVHTEIEKRNDTDGDCRCVILSAVCINDIDVAGINAIRTIINDLKEQSVQLILAGVKGRVRDVMNADGLDETIYVSIHDACYHQLLVVLVLLMILLRLLLLLPVVWWYRRMAKIMR